MTDMMVGHKVTLNITRPEPVNPQPRLEVKGLTVRSEEGIVKLKDVSFTAYSGEILGIAGISGCGQKELLEAIAGLQPTESGSVVYIEAGWQHGRSCSAKIHRRSWISAFLFPLYRRTVLVWGLSATWI